MHRARLSQGEHPGAEWSPLGDGWGSELSPLMAMDGREWSAWEQTVKITGEYGSGTVSPWASPILHSFNKYAWSPHDVGSGTQNHWSESCRGHSNGGGAEQACRSLLHPDGGTREVAVILLHWDAGGGGGI